MGLRDIADWRFGHRCGHSRPSRQREPRPVRRRIALLDSPGRVVHGVNQTNRITHARTSRPRVASRPHRRSGSARPRSCRSGRGRPSTILPSAPISTSTLPARVMSVHSPVSVDVRRSSIGAPSERAKVGKAEQHVADRFVLAMPSSNDRDHPAVTSGGIGCHGKPLMTAA